MELKNVDVFAILCVGVALRAVVSLHSYSGKSSPPLYGDYEAQRHWQEITVNLNPAEWYKNTSDNDLLYWGLDYPPLTAYHSYGMGVLAKSLNRSYITLGESRGIETSKHKSFMRFTVLFADCFVYLPAVLILGEALRNRRLSSMLEFVALLVLYPGQILIDNGHFQYNNISLGLCALAMAAILNDSALWAATLFTLALNYKQMELYHALPFFVYLLQMCFQQKSFFRKIWTFGAIACTVIITFIALWIPWLGSVNSMKTVLIRIFPIARGVFEDKVANFWCIFNVFCKLKLHFSNVQMAIICLLTTILGILPTIISLFLDTNKRAFLQSLTSTAMAFYLFSFQVHEKSIILAALPACCLFAWKPLEVLWFLECSAFSMVPLFIKDGLVASFIALLLIFHICIKDILLYYTHNKLRFSKIVSLSVYSIFTLTAMSLILPAPARYPHLWSLIISAFSFCNFILFYFYINVYQIYFKC